MESKKTINTFIRSGCLILSLFLIGYAFMHFVVPAVKITSLNDSRKIPIYSVNTPNKQVAISFDAAWGNEDTTILLDILAKYNIKTTFFMTGGWIEKYPDDVKRIYEAGHDLANHSENHKQMSTLSAAQCQEEIQKAHDKVKSLTGIDMNLFRPPYGEYNNQLVEVANAMNYHVIQWSVDSLDWKDYGADNIVSTILNHEDLKDGAIILMHNGAKYTKDALEQVILGLQEKGFEIVPISQLIYTDNYTTDHTGCQYSNTAAESTSIPNVVPTTAEATPQS